MPKVFAKSLLGIVAVLVAAGVTSAQDPQQLFQEGVQALRLGKRAEALEKFQALLKADPSNEAAMELWKKTDQDIWSMLLIEKGEVSQIARHLMNLASMGRKARSRDEAKIKELVAQACADDFGVRSQAISTLVSEYGEFAVPALVEKLGNADDDKGQTHAVLTLQYLDRSATLPLVELLGHENMLVRRNAAAALAHIGDPRAAAALARVAKEDANEGVRTAAKKGLERILGKDAGANPVDLYLADAHGYLAGKNISDRELSDVVWSLDKSGKLTATDIPAPIYALELAKKNAHAAMLLDQVNEKAQTILAQAYLAQASVIADAVAARPDDEAMKAQADKVPGLQMMAMMTGPQVLRRAVTASLNEGLVTVAAAAIKALGAAEDRENLAKSPLVAALDHADKRVSYSAALALTAAAEGRAIPASAKVVSVLGQAITEEAVRVIKVIDSDPGVAKVASEASGKRGTAVEATASGLGGLEKLLQFPVCDVLVINEKVADVLPETLIGILRKDARFAKTKIVVAATEPDKAKERFGDKVNGVVKTGFSADELGKAVDEALKDEPLDAQRAAANAVAVAASQALADLGASRVDLSPALGNLCAQLSRADAVAVPAAKAIGEAGSVAQLDSLAVVVKDEAKSAEAKIAAAQAIGQILGRSAEAPAGLIDPMLAVLGSSADAKVKAAIVTALGKGKFAPGERLKMIEALRTLGAAPAAPAAEAKAETPKG